MREIIGDLFDYCGEKNIVVIPTNGKYVYSSQRAIMGAGVALQAAERWPSLPNELGKMLARHGNVVHKFYITEKTGVQQWVATFPTKEHWAEVSQLRLIAKSAQDLLRWVDTLEIGYTVYLPRMWCGLGCLRWAEVRPVLEKYLDERFTVVALAGEI